MTDTCKELQVMAKSQKRTETRKEEERSCAGLDSTTFMAQLGKTLPYLGNFCS
jgi:hypothetical protein